MAGTCCSQRWVGTKEHHSEVAFRADRLRGPYVARGAPILTQEGLDPARPDRVVQAGHADLVQTPACDWWSVFLASRPVGPGQLDYLTGRETFLLPVKWQDGWPVIVPAGRGIPPRGTAPRLAPSAGLAPAAGGNRYAPPWRSAALDGRWLTLGSVASPWWRAGGGQLRVMTHGAPLGGVAQPALLAIRQSDPRVTLHTTVRIDAHDGGAGLAAYADTGHFWALLVGRHDVRLIRRSGSADDADGVTVARAPLRGVGSGPVRLRLAIDGEALAFDYAEATGGWHSLGGRQDGHNLSVTTTNDFTGTVLGVVVVLH